MCPSDEVCIRCLMISYNLHIVAAGCYIENLHLGERLNRFSVLDAHCKRVQIVNGTLVFLFVIKH